MSGIQPLWFNSKEWSQAKIVWFCSVISDSGLWFLSLGQLRDSAHWLEMHYCPLPCPDFKDWMGGWAQPKEAQLDCSYSFSVWKQVHYKIMITYAIGIALKLHAISDLKVWLLRYNPHMTGTVLNIRMTSVYNEDPVVWFMLACISGSCAFIA